MKGLNNSIEAGLEALYEYIRLRDIGEHPTNGLKVLSETWSNIRMGNTGTIGNVQRSKNIMRAIFQPEQWSHEINVGVNEKSYGVIALEQSILEGFGKDGVDVYEARDVFKDIVYDVKTDTFVDPLIGKAVALTTKAQTADLTPKQQATLSEAIREMGHDVHSLQALTALGEYTTALRGSKKKKGIKLTTQLGLELDGTTNGLSNLLMELAPMGNPKVGKNKRVKPMDYISKYVPLLSAVGVFFDKGTTSVKAHHDAGGLDLYQRLAEKLHMAMTLGDSSTLSVDGTTGLRATDYVPELVDEHGKVTTEGRKYVKPTTMTVPYGLGVTALGENIASDIIAKFYADLVTADAKVLAELDLWVGLPTYQDGKKRPLADMTVEERREFILDEYQTHLITERVNERVAVPMLDALDAELGEMLSARDALNSLFNVAMIKGKASFDLRVAKKSKELKRELTQQEFFTTIEEAIEAKEFPELGVPSRLAQDKDAGVAVLPITDEALPHGQGGLVGVRTELKNIPITRKTDKGETQDTVDGLSGSVTKAVLDSNVGVVPSLRQNIFFDSYVQSLMMTNPTSTELNPSHHVMNVHDAVIRRADQYLQGAVATNKAWADSHSQYHTHELFGKLLKFIEDGKGFPEELQKEAFFNKDQLKTHKELTGKLGRAYKDKAPQADIRKLFTSLSNLRYSVPNLQTPTAKLLDTDKGNYKYVETVSKKSQVPHTFESFLTYSRNMQSSLEAAKAIRNDNLHAVDQYSARGGEYFPGMTNGQSLALVQKNMDHAVRGLKPVKQHTPTTRKYFEHRGDEINTQSLENLTKAIASHEKQLKAYTDKIQAYRDTERSVASKKYNHSIMARRAGDKKLGKLSGELHDLQFNQGQVKYDRWGATSYESTTKDEMFRQEQEINHQMRLEEDAVTKELHVIRNVRHEAELDKARLEMEQARYLDTLHEATQGTSIVLRGSTPYAVTPSQETLVDEFQLNVQNIGTVAGSLHAQEGSVVSEENTQLLKMVKDIITPVFQTLGDFTLSRYKSGKANFGNIDGAARTITLNEAKTPKGLRNGMSLLQVYTHEMIHPVWDMAISLDKSIHAALVVNQRKFVAVTDHTLFLADISNPTKRETKEAKAAYDYITSPDETGLLEFATYSVTNPFVRKALKGIIMNTGVRREAMKPTDISTALFNGNFGVVARNLLDHMANGFHNMVDSFKNKLNKDSGINHIDDLITQAMLVSTVGDSKYLSYSSKVDSMNAWVKKYGVDKAAAWLMSINNTTQFTSKVAQTLVSIPHGVKIIGRYVLSENYSSKFDEYITDLRMGRAGFLAKLVQELMRSTPDVRKYETLALAKRQHVDTHQKYIKDSVVNSLRGQFRKPMTKQEWADIGTVMVDLDLQSLLTTYSIKDVTDLLTKPSTVVLAIMQEEAFIKKASPVLYKYMTFAAENLGHYLHTGVDKFAGLQVNAHNIVNLEGTSPKQKTAIAKKQKLRPDDTSISTEERIASVDRLATLYGIMAAAENSGELLRRVGVIAAKEAQRTDVAKGDLNGVGAVLATHFDAQMTYRKHVLNDSTTKHRKGFTRSVNTTAHVTSKLGTKADEHLFATQGYARSSEPLSSSIFKGTTMYTYHSTSNMDDAAYNSGILSTRGKISYGTSVKAAAKAVGIDTNSDDYRNHVSTLDKAFRIGVVGLLVGKPTPGIQVVGAPADAGHNRSKYEVLNPDKSNQEYGADVKLGATTGYAATTPAVANYNEQLADLIHQHALDNVVTPGDTGQEGTDYLDMTNTKDPKVMALHKLIPRHILKRMQVTTDTGEVSPLYINKKAFDVIFGYYSLSAANTVSTKSLTTEGKKLRHQFKRAIQLMEKMWSAVVSRAKKNIVIFTPAVLTANIISNTMLLMMKGIRPDRAVTMQYEAWRELLRYQTQLKEYTKLSIKIKQRKALGKKTKALESKLARNKMLLDNMSVAPLIESGAFQLVEELTTEEIESDDGVLGIFGEFFKTRIGQATPPEAVVTGVSDWISKQGKTKLGNRVGTVLKYVRGDTDLTLYQNISNATQYSDFVARHALYTHRMKQHTVDAHKRKHLGKDKFNALNAAASTTAMEEIMEVFVNYDIPSSAQLEYANKMGLVMFTKYLLRIQRVIASMLRNNAGSMAVFAALQQLTYDVPDAYQSSLLLGLRVTTNTPDDIIDEAFSIIPLRLLGIDD